MASCHKSNFFFNLSLYPIMGTAFKIQHKRVLENISYGRLVKRSSVPIVDLQNVSLEPLLSALETQPPTPKHRGLREGPVPTPFKIAIC